VPATLVRDEVRALEDAILSIALLPHRYVGRDFLLLDQPAQELTGAVSAARRFGLRSKQASVRSIMVLVAATSS
jgi:hypothetical protein